MRSSVQKWGNSLAVRIPKPFAAEIDLAENTPVEIEVSDGVISIRPAADVWRLDALVRGITARNRHRETDWGDATGDEPW